ncbi:MAG: hypothetical protein M1820_004339 [Bogoriella megaspora]|nr:MAG: hypothetical protein M1820_004339 [Bogoriella megaspora]
MSETLNLSIPTTSIAQNPKPHTLYHISIPHPLRTITLPKRYTDFLTLDTSLRSATSTPPPAPLPPKHWLTNTVSSPTLTESRRHDLEAYLQSIATSPDSRWRDTSAWRTFLNLPSNTSITSLKSGNTGGRTTIKTSAQWLDVHAQLKTQLRDARQAIARREQVGVGNTGGGPGGWHEAGAEAKKALVRAGTLVAELENGLKILGEGGSGEKLAEGEVRRRRDLLGNARKEREALESVLSSSVMRDKGGLNGDMVDSVKSTVGTAGVAADKGALLAGASSSNKPTSGRRVLGAAPIPETTRTRELDNEGVLQLQKQIMQEQDEDVVDLTKVVRRMKEMGIQINDELEVQKAMLDMVDEDVERVDGKIRIAKKRVDKIK